ncbi:hypothetical protein [Listeria booriae]|uniref:Resolvase HTH domain-containing protein n=2 Tax=Listeria TaxID=1637 RepID=A0A099WBY1_9LIST|nr:hypothetical protein [Listeria booriae]KGL41610.1 hypothetical protein EP57_07140 [Listeria booriae]MBC1209423.1 hypothetical protein [Listeria booriae]MBC1229859.1 hypothetical protein [Listeria booriae]MBC1272088.1 hypothetical protein [Listeria booriae]MBC1284778.1 hypothetical protein [Listeria booriae]
MTVLIIILLACSVVLFLLSFMQKGNSKQLESELEEIASQLMQENFELKKRVSTLENTMKIDADTVTPVRTSSKKLRDLRKKQIINLYTSGVTIEEIIVQSELSEEQVNEIIAEYVAH